jgi:hypothetical protein
MSLSSSEINELVSAAEEIQNAMSESWRECFPLPFELTPFRPTEIQQPVKARRKQKTLTATQASA